MRPCIAIEETSCVGMSSLVEVYVDDVIIKTWDTESFLSDLVETFGNLRRFSTKLLDVQKLTGCMAALCRFISRLGIRGLPFFKLLKKLDNFHWTPEAQEPFEELKRYLSKPPTLVAPEPGETLQLYIWQPTTWSTRQLWWSGMKKTLLGRFSNQ